MKEKFIMRVDCGLLIKLRMNGVDPTEASVFFGAQAEQMLDCKPNYGPNSAKITTAKIHQLRKDVWLMRGFYPHTAQMFRISISENDAYMESYQYYVKVSEPSIRVPVKKKERQLDLTKRNECTFGSNLIAEQLRNRLEKEILGVETEITSLINSKVVFTPKCISPKGMKKFTLDLKKG